MNASNVFRTSLMQQFAASARGQSIPPLAMRWLSELHQPQPQQTTNSQQAPPSRAQRTTTVTMSGVGVDNSKPDASLAPNLTSFLATTTTTTTTTAANPRRSATTGGGIDGTVVSNNNMGSNLQLLLSSSSSSSLSRLPDPSRRSLSVVASCNLDDDEAEDYSDGQPEAGGSGDDDYNDGSRRFQELLQTRRTRNQFAPMTIGAADAESHPSFSYWMGVLERAALCGYSAPNHRRTEPFTFKRMIAPSAKTRRLADIAYHTNLLKKQKQQDQQQGSADLAAAADPATIRKALEASAEKKRERWNRIPAFLVTTVASHDSVVVDPSDLARTDQYGLLPYASPQSERELEDYAAACAAVQNVLLSLHSENVASKWVTGPVVQTPAFRELVEASPHDRVVALIMVGKPDDSKRLFPRRRHRKLHGDVLVDL